MSTRVLDSVPRSVRPDPSHHTQQDINHLKAGVQRAAHQYPQDLAHLSGSIANSGEASKYSLRAASAQSQLSDDKLGSSVSLDLQSTLTPPSDNRQLTGSANARDDAYQTPNASLAMEPPSQQPSRRPSSQSQQASPHESITVSREVLLPGPPEGTTIGTELSEFDVAIEHDAVNSVESANVLTEEWATPVGGDNASQKELGNVSLNSDIREPSYSNSARRTPQANAFASRSSMQLQRVRRPFLPSSRTVVKPADPLGNWMYLHNAAESKNTSRACDPTFGESMRAYQFRGAGRKNTLHNNNAQPVQGPWRGPCQRKPSDLGY